MTSLFGNAKFISCATPVIGRRTGTANPTLRFRRAFDLKAMPKKATVRIAGLGCFLLYINGKRVSDELLSPAFTDYTKTVLYCEYDVTPLLREGKNLICAEVGSGYFNQSEADTWSFHTAPWRDFQKLLFALVLDGEIALVSDKGFRVSRVIGEDGNPTFVGPCYYSVLRVGERYDARLEDGWLDPDFDDRAWMHASFAAHPGGKLKKQSLPPMRVCERLKPVKSWASKNGRVYDFGKGISGVCEVSMKARRGTEMTIRYGEVLDGCELDSTHIGCYQKIDRFSEDTYIFKGGEKETHHASFVYHGFQFVEILGAAPKDDEITALFIRTDLKSLDDFSTSDEHIAWFAEAAKTSLLANFHGFSEDCPHREKNGWTGDASLSAAHACLRLDMRAAYKKYLLDIIDTQRISGQISCVCPTAGWGYNWAAGPSWDSALFFIPEAIYKAYGDDSAYRLIRPYAKKYFSYMEGYEEDGCICVGLKDWKPPLTLRGANDVATNEFSDSCFYMEMLRLFGEALTRFNDKDANYYLQKSEYCKNAIRKKYLDGDKADNDSPSALGMALFFGIAEGEAAQRMADRLAEKIEAARYTAPCGILGMKAIFGSLAKYGHAQVLYKMLTTEEYPSFGYWKSLGATTLWEDFEGKESRLHHMYASPMDFVLPYIGGIENVGIGFSEVRFAPYLYSEDCASHYAVKTKYGKISIDWQYKDGVFKARIRKPKGVKATLSVLGKCHPVADGESECSII
jgi:alpha-L-rhamnosidase